MKRGLRIEDEVRSIFAKMMKCRINPGYLQLSRAYPLMAATPDGVAKDFTVEIKSPEKNENQKNYLRQDGVPTKKVLIQMLMQMRFCNRKYGYLVIADENFEMNKKVNVTRVELIDHVIHLEQCLESADNFWKRFVFLRLMKIMRPVMILE